MPVMTDNTTELTAANLNKFVSAGDFDAANKRLCYGTFMVSASTPSLIGEVGLASVSRLTTGIYLVNFNSAMTSIVSYQVALINSAGNFSLVPVVSSKTVAGFRIYIFDRSTGNLVNDDVLVDILIIGG